MTGFNSGSPAPYTGGAIEAIVRRVQDLERGYREIQSKLVVQGNVSVQDGSGNLLSLSALAFNGTAVETPATFTAAGGGAWHTDPLEPTITVTVSTVDLPVNRCSSRASARRTW